MAGFSFECDQAAKAANESLPAAASMLHKQVAELDDPTELRGPGNLDVSVRAQHVLADFTGYLTSRHHHAAQVVQQTAEALREIIDVYRQTDGQDGGHR